MRCGDTANGARMLADLIGGAVRGLGRAVTGLLH